MLLFPFGSTDEREMTAGVVGSCVIQKADQQVERLDLMLQIYGLTLVYAPYTLSKA